MKKNKHNLLMTMLLLLTSGWAMAQDAFITTWKTDNEGTSEDNEITIPTEGTGYDYSVDWGDGNADDNVTGDITHTYASSGTYTVSITGDFPRIYFNSFFGLLADAEKIMSIEQWGNIEWTSMEHAFSGCNKLVINATDAPNLSGATSTKFMFGKAQALDSDLNNWDVKTITDMSAMFANTDVFNGDVTNWDVSSVVNFASMFAAAKIFSQDIGEWNVGNGENFNAMFASADGFNVNLNDWDVSNASNIGAMFANTDLFNQPLDNWDVSNVTNMIQTFVGAKVYNQPIGNWDVSKVNNMKGMFQSASVFNQSLNDWDVSKVLSMESMFEGAKKFNSDISDWNLIKVSNTKRMFIFDDDFNQDLSDWDVSKVVLMNDMFNRAISFNSDISNWDVSAVTSMSGMFYSATSFDKNLSKWDVSLVADMGEMFDESGLSTTNYDNTLIGWAAQTLQNGVELGAANAAYCKGAAARAILTGGPNSWIIADAGESCRPFITTWLTTTPGEQITIPTAGTGYNYSIDWGDGSSNGNVMGDVSYTYAAAGTHTVTISGDFPRIYFNSVGDKDKILTIEQWGDIAWSSMDRAFFGCSNLTMPATDAPNLSDVVSMFRTFSRCTVFDGNISNWDVSNVTNFFATFADAIIFNQDIGDWNVSNALNMRGMFEDAEAFNQNINDWDVSSVTNLNGMFFSTTSFNQPLNDWELNSAIDIQEMFFSAIAFNQPLDKWRFPLATSITNMFRNSTSFNQDLSDWEVGNIDDMGQLFWAASSFNQDLSEWDVSEVTDMTNMFSDTDLSVINYDEILQGWAAQTVQNAVPFGASGVEYCLGATARTTLTSGPNNWVITDGGENCIVNIPDANFKAALLANATINTIDDGEITLQEAETYNGTIDVSNLSISDLTGIEYFENITELKASNNSLTTVDLSNNTQLVTLWIRDNNLTSIDLSTLAILTELSIGDNQLTSIDVGSNTGLRKLYIGNNNITSLNIDANTLLVLIYVHNNELTSLSVTTNTSLQDISAHGNNFSTIDLSSNVALRKLTLSGSSITALDMTSNTLLRELSISNCLLTSLDLSANTALERLFALNNSLNELNVANGNNNSMTAFNSTGNPNLTCISVDDVAFAEANFTDVDAEANFSTDCSNTDNDILTFSIPEEISAAGIDATSHTVTVEVAIGTDVSSLTPTFTISAGAVVDEASGVAQDFGSAFVYTVTAENPIASQSWTINVAEENAAPTDISLDNTNIDENNAIGAVMGVLSSLDANASNSHTYSLVAGAGDTDNALFSIAGSNLVANESFDFETKSSYSVRIQTDDGRGGMFTKEFSISVNDLSGVVQTIAFNPITDVSIDVSSFELSASSTSGLEVNYSTSDESVATIAGSIVTIIGVGTTTITASQAGDRDYAVATNVEQTLTVNKLNQSITFSALTDVTFGDATINLTGTTDADGLSVSYTSSDETVATISGTTVTIIGAGTSSITASQAGDASYAAATDVMQSLIVNKADQSITFEAIEDKMIDDADFDIATASSSSLDVTISVSGPASISGTTITLDGTVGTVTLTASQSGDNNYNEASDVTVSFEVSAPAQETQTITFTAIEDQFLEAGSMILIATASSGLDVSYEVLSGPATSLDNVITFTALGEVVVSASQQGNDSFLAADPVEQSFEVITVTGRTEFGKVEITTYPNPVVAKLYINGKAINQLQLFDLNGKLIISKQSVNQLDVSGLKAGQYVLRISTENEMITRKIIKH